MTLGSLTPGLRYVNPGYLQPGQTLTYTTEDFRCHVLVKLAEDDSHVVPLWAEEDVKVSDAILRAKTRRPSHPQAHSRELCRLGGR